MKDETEPTKPVRSTEIPMVVPSHKNQLRPSKNGGMYLDMRARKQRDALMLYLKQLTPITEEFSVGCDIQVDVSAGITTVGFYPVSVYDHVKCPDIDGIATAIFDAAQKCGVLFNDNRVKFLKVEAK